ncbi:hypothetical protein [Roseobacter sinensis]|uniref:Uncharacterized protein n=1 Tax=Roseobacter sinensis TaxID=2931391 RepID=A0ABT3BIN9_9RHOB|nr:hypothetical protein [Roseobacter sp. WL0113]MCV3273432.1 hypothetical protein [Roseobacter sp. WL0113]
MTWQPGDLVDPETSRFTIRSIEREDVTDEFLTWFTEEDAMVGPNMPQRRMTVAQAHRWTLGSNNTRRFFLLVLDRERSMPIGFFTAVIDMHEVDHRRCHRGPKLLGAECRGRSARGAPRLSLRSARCLKGDRQAAWAKLRVNLQLPGNGVHL